MPPLEDRDDLISRALAIVEKAICLPPERREIRIRTECGDDSILLETCLGILAMHQRTDLDFAGKTIDNYKIHMRLGAGGQGKVYVATRLDTPSKVAIKFLPPAHSESSTLRRFRREKQILAALEHDNIVTYIDQGETEEGWHYFVMQFVEGRSIVDFCRKRDLAIRERLALFQQLLSAMEHAHKRYIHRDLKPSNILVNSDGRVKVLDFGIAKAQYLDDAFGPEDLASTQPYSEEYASPEQLKSEEVTAASDIYQLGVILYEMIAGRRPFEDGRPIEEYRQAVRFEQPPTPSRVATRDAALSYGLSSELKLRAALRGELDAIALKALCLRPHQRYPSVTALALDIQRYLAGEPVSAYGCGWPYRYRKFVKRHWQAAALSGALLASLMMGVALLWRTNRALVERNQSLSATGSVVTGLRQAKIDLEKELALERVSLSNLRTQANTKLLAIQTEISKSAAARPRDYARVYEAIAKALDGQRIPAGEVASFLSERTREILVQARELRELAGDTEEASELALQIRAMGGAPRGRPDIALDPAELAGQAHVSTARLHMSIAELQEAIGDLGGASVTLREAVEVLTLYRESNPDAGRLLERGKQRLAKLTERIPIKQ